MLTRWLGVGLAAILAVVTIGLGLTGRLGLYINPDSTWFAVGMAVVVLLGTALSFALPLGAETEHGHGHAHGHGRAPGHDHGHDRAPVHAHAHSAAGAPAAGSRRSTPTWEDDGEAHRYRRDARTFGRTTSVVATTVGGVAASAVVLLTLLLPPASLSAELAISRDVGAPPLFAGSDAVALAATGDTSSFGVGDWSTVFATATNPDAFDGDSVTLTGFVTPPSASDGAAFDLTRLVITHCVIDAQPANLPIIATESVPETGQWVTITGTVASTSDGRLRIEAASVEPIAEPGDPYEH